MMQKDMGGINSFFYESIQLILDELTTLFFVKLENSSEFAKLLENLNANGKRIASITFFAKLLKWLSFAII